MSAALAEALGESSWRAGWIAKHPIDGPLYTRHTSVIDYAEMALAQEDLAQVAASLDEQVASISRRLTLRWRRQ